MKLLLFIGIIALALTACSQNETGAAGEKSATNGKSGQASTPDGSNVIRVSVPSMQCESCAKTIKGALKEVEGAGEVDVNVDEKTVFVHVSDNTPAMKAQIEHAISDAGYKTETLDRNNEAYESLPDCCKDEGHGK